MVVQGVVPGSAAEAAGLAPGDVLLKIGEVELRPEEDWAAKFRQRYRGQAGAPLAIALQRAAQPLTLTPQVHERPAVACRLKLLPSAPPKPAEILPGPK